MKKVPRTEKEIQKAILAALKVWDIPAWKVGSGLFQVQGRYVKMGQKGMADIIGILPPLKKGEFGRFLALEVKRPGGKVSTEQQAFLDRVNKAGGLGAVVSSIDELADLLEGAR